MTSRKFLNGLQKVHFTKWFEWYYKTHVRTLERFRMVMNRKTSEILDDLITNEIIQKHLKH